MNHLFRKHTLTLIALFLGLIIILGGNGRPAVSHASAAADPIIVGCTDYVGDVAALIAAFNEANSDPDESTIQLGEYCAYTLTAPATAGGITGLPLVSHNLILEGNGSAIAREDQGPPLRFLVLQDNVQLTANNLGLYGGSLPQEDGGAIYLEPGAALTLNQGYLDYNEARKGGAIYASSGASVTLNGTYLYGNFASEEGGAIYADAGSSLTLDQAFVDDSRAKTGGGIYTQGEAIIRDSYFEYNETTLTGGAIQATAALTIERSDFEDNYAEQGGGAIYAVGETTIQDSRFIENGTNDLVADGGAVWASGVLTVSDSYFAYNYANEGGGIYGKDVQITDSDFYDNYAYNTSGGVYAENASRGIHGARFEYNTADGFVGGGLYVWADLDLQRSYFHANESKSVGGGLYVRGEGTSVVVANNLWVDNVSRGAIGNVMVTGVKSGGTISIRHNTAVHTGSIQTGSGILIAGPGVVENNIITGFATGLLAQSQLAVSRSNLYFNNTTNEQGFAAPGTDSLVADPRFVGEGNYRLAEGSPAIDSAGATDTTADILGTARPQGAKPDRGAYEFNGEPETVFPVTCAGGAAELVAAFAAANRNFGPDVIELEGPDCIYELTTAAGVFGYDGPTGLPAVMDTLWLDGNGAIVQRQESAAPFRLLENYASSLTLEELTLRNGLSEGSGYGGAIYSFYDTALHLNNVRLHNNEADDDGGAIYSFDTLTVKNSELIGNHAGDDGGAIYADYGIDLQASTFVGNSTGTSTADYGGGLYLVIPDSGATVENNVWLNNQAGGRGAAIYLMDYNPAVDSIRHNTIAGNGTPDSVAVYQFSYLPDGSSVRVENNIITGHAVGVMREFAGKLETNNNLYFNNALNEVGATSSTNHIKEDPLFRNLAGGDARLQRESPAIDRAANLGVTKDRNGISRPQGNGNDIGAYEYLSNFFPRVTADAYTTSEDIPLVIAAPGVLGNDIDDDLDPLAAVLETSPTHGELTLNADGSFTYTPDAGFSGNDSFTYYADDYDDPSEPATVTIEVVPQGTNVPPSAAADAFTTKQDKALEIPAPGVLDNDQDVNGDPLTAMLETEPANGTVTLNADGSFSYTPNTGYTGSDSFSYRANDGQASSTAAVVTITILPAGANLPPLAFSDRYETARGQTLTIAAPGVLGNDQDGDGDSLTAVLESQPAHGELALNADGSFTYTPDTGFSGSDSFTYRAGDGRTRSAAATVTIRVRPSGGQVQRLLLPVVVTP